MPPTPAADDRPESRCSRRSLLRTGVLGGGVAAVLAAAGPRTGAPAAAAARVPAAAPAPMENLFTLADLDFDTLFAFGGTGYGSAEFGELVRAVDQTNAAGASYQTYYDTFRALAQRTATQAGQDLAAGHRASARSGYLRAASYYDLVLYFILGTTARAQEAAAYAAMQRCWQQASQLSEPPFEPVKIPYGNTWMPGYLLRPDDRPVRRPTVILNNGEDAQNIRMWAFGGAAALERGYNALIFEGPGQGSMLFERQIPFRSDWEKVITPVVDYLRSRPEVDRSRIVLSGSSLGGELVVRAAAFEHRLAALVADPGFLSIWLSWQTGFAAITSLFTQGLSKDQINTAWQQKIVPTLDAGDRFNLAKISEGYGRSYLRAARAGQVFTDLYDLGTTLMKFTVADVAGQVTAPTLVTAYDGDTLVVPPTGQGTKVYQLLTGPKQFHQFTTAQGADQHCAPMAPQTRNQAVYDWLDSVL
ncbi:MAG TPA: acetylxylan esterase [Streptosporangiaceae bacterium]|nr:acetylxylan esterase [Streptosporangiaceae bacterium]